MKNYSNNAIIKLNGIIFYISLFVVVITSLISSHTKVLGFFIITFPIIIKYLLEKIKKQETKNSYIWAYYLPLLSLIIYCVLVLFFSKFSNFVLKTELCLFKINQIELFETIRTNYISFAAFLFLFIISLLISDKYVKNIDLKHIIQSFLILFFSILLTNNVLIT